MNTKPSLVLHIGTEKTGTSTIQEFLRLNRKGYADQGVIIPDYLGSPNLPLFTCCFYSDQRHDEVSMICGMNDMDVRRRRRDQTLSRFKDQIKSTNSGKFVLSSELLQSRLVFEQEIQSLYDFLSPLFHAISVILYIRKPIETAVSWWSTQVKYGHVMGSLPSPSDPYVANLCMHKETILRWSNCFGKSNISVRLFRQDTFFKNDLIHDFILASDIDYPRDVIMPPVMNQKMGLDGLLFLSKINKKIPLFGMYRINPFRQNLTTYFLKHFSRSSPYVPSTRDHIEYLNWYDYSNHWVKCEYFDHLSSLWGDSDDFSLTNLTEEINTEVDRDQDILNEHYLREDVSRLLSLFTQVWLDKHKKIFLLEAEVLQKAKEVNVLSNRIKILEDAIRKSLD